VPSPDSTAFTAILYGSRYRTIDGLNMSFNGRRTKYGPYAVFSRKQRILSHDFTLAHFASSSSPSASPSPLGLLSFHLKPGYQHQMDPPFSLANATGPRHRDSCQPTSRASRATSHPGPHVTSSLLAVYNLGIGLLSYVPRSRFVLVSPLVAYMYIITFAGLGEGNPVELQTTHSPPFSTRVLATQASRYNRYKSPSRVVGATSSHYGLHRTSCPIRTACAELSHPTHARSPADTRIYRHRTP
jgi:hypothetical protein